MSKKKQSNTCDTNNKNNDSIKPSLDHLDDLLETVFTIVEQDKTITISYKKKIFSLIIYLQDEVCAIQNKNDLSWFSEKIYQLHKYIISNQYHHPTENFLNLLNDIDTNYPVLNDILNNSNNETTSPTSNMNNNNQLTGTTISVDNTEYH